MKKLTLSKTIKTLAVTAAFGATVLFSTAAYADHPAAKQKTKLLSSSFLRSNTGTHAHSTSTVDEKKTGMVKKGSKYASSRILRKGVKIGPMLSSKSNVKMGPYHGGKTASHRHSAKPHTYNRVK